MINEKINIRIKSGLETFLISNALVISDLALPEQNFTKELVNFCWERVGVRTSPYCAAPELLIGQDNCELIINPEFHVIIEGALIASRCLLGWTIHGHEKRSSNPKQINTVKECSRKNCKRRDSEFDSIVRAYFDIDTLGINTMKKMNSEDEKALNQLESTSRYNGDSWKVGLP